MQDKIDVFLLAAGEANRMYPLNQIIEKSLLPVDGKPVIRHIVDKLLESNCINRYFICCLNKFKKQFEHEFRDTMDEESINIKGFEEPMGTFTTWVLASSDIDTSVSSELCMVHYADCLTDIDYNDFISKIDDKSDGLIAVTNTVKHDYSEVSFTIDNIVQDFVEKPNVMNYSWSGIGLFKTKSLWPYYKFDEMDFALDIFPKMIENNHSLRAYPYHGYWADVGNLNSYRKICEKFQNGDMK